MGFELGETYSGYRFLDVSKRTKSGVEYRVQNTFAQRVELLRTLPQGAQDDQELNERFVREMRVRARLVHPNIVTMFNAVEINGQLVMTMEMVDGTTLAERLSLGPIPWKDAVGMLRQILAAVGFAHEQQVVHRDISPENIIITSNGSLKLTNFGLAKQTASPKLTQMGAVIGNLKYISPEQVKGTSETDARSDLYSLGIVFYEMLCGRTPFDSKSQFELMAAQVNEQPAPPSSAARDLPVEFDSVVLKALAKSPGDRYQWAAEFDQAVVGAASAAEQRLNAPAVPAHAVIETAPGPVIAAVSPAPFPYEPPTPNGFPPPPAFREVAVAPAEVPVAGIASPLNGFAAESGTDEPASIGWSPVGAPLVAEAPGNSFATSSNGLPANSSAGFSWNPPAALASEAAPGFATTSTTTAVLPEGPLMPPEPPRSMSSMLPSAVVTAEPPRPAPAFTVSAQPTVTSWSWLLYSGMAVVCLGLFVLLWFATR